MFEITLNLGGKEIVIAETIVNTYIVTFLLIIFAIVVNRKIKNAKPEDTPSGLLNVVEVAVEAIQTLVKQNMGEKQIWFAPYIFSLAFFLLVSNLFGLFGFTPPTSDYNVTLTLALITFTLTQFYGIKNNGIVGYAKGFLDPFPFLLPLNILGELANPISLSFRLFGNILSGVIIMSLLYNALGLIAPLITPVLHAYFDVFSGILQTFIFTMLTMIFIGGSFDD